MENIIVELSRGLEYGKLGGEWDWWRRMINWMKRFVVDLTTKFHFPYAVAEEMKKLDAYPVVFASDG